jgi:hypothetical protein
LLSLRFTTASTRWIRRSPSVSRTGPFRHVDGDGEIRPTRRLSRELGLLGVLVVVGVPQRHQMAIVTATNAARIEPAISATVPTVNVTPARFTGRGSSLIDTPPQLGHLPLEFAALHLAPVVLRREVEVLGLQLLVVLAAFAVLVPQRLDLLDVGGAAIDRANAVERNSTGSQGSDGGGQEG